MTQIIYPLRRKSTYYIKWKKLSGLEDKVPTASALIDKTQYDANKQNLQN